MKRGIRIGALTFKRGGKGAVSTPKMGRIENN